MCCSMTTTCGLSFEIYHNVLCGKSRKNDTRIQDTMPQILWTWHFFSLTAKNLCFLDFSYLIDVLAVLDCEWAPITTGQLGIYPHC
jgi:hypothetical protein